MPENNSMIIQRRRGTWRTRTATLTYEVVIYEDIRPRRRLRKSEFPESVPSYRLPVLGRQQGILYDRAGVFPFEVLFFANAGPNLDGRPVRPPILAAALGDYA